jgi:hypothetical protein
MIHAGSFGRSSRRMRRGAFAARLCVFLPVLNGCSIAQTVVRGKLRAHDDRARRAGRPPALSPSGAVPAVRWAWTDPGPLRPRLLRGAWRSLPPALSVRASVGRAVWRVARRATDLVDDGDSGLRRATVDESRTVRSTSAFIVTSPSAALSRLRRGHPQWIAMIDKKQHQAAIEVRREDVPGLIPWHAKAWVY